MPNHYTTRITFAKKPSTKLQALLDAYVAGKDELCQHLLPMPELLRNTGRGLRTFDVPGGEPVSVSSWYENRETGKSRLFTPDEAKELAALGCTDWYEWANRNWGTKWGTYHWARLSDTVYEFESAWGPPEADIFQMLADKYGAVFELEGRDEFEDEFSSPSCVFKPAKERKKKS